MSSISCFIFIVVLCIILISSFGKELTIATNVVDGNSVSTIKVFAFQSDDLNVEIAVIQFCKENNVDILFCKILFEEALYQQVENNIDLYKEAEIDIKYANFDSLMPNSLLGRKALPIPRASGSDGFSLDEKRILNTIIESQSSIPERYVVVHSCTFPGQSAYAILEIQLNQILESGLATDGKTYTIILNYGVVLPQSLLEKYRPVFQHRLVLFEVSTTVTRYELPTLRFIRGLADALVAVNMKHGQILYLHTKGVSYVEKSPQIEDWRNMMMYFLVERHQTCYHLLASGEFDAVGVNFQSTDDNPPHFSGNFWWATAKYLSSLPLLEYNEYKHVNKQNSEFWLLQPFASTRNVQPKRVHSLHNSYTWHYQELYPRERYVIVA